MTEEAPKTPPARIIKNTQRKPCGCVITEFSDGQGQLAPCVPCGLRASAHHLGAAAQAMMQAGQAMAATAESIVREQQQAVLEQAAQAGAHRLRPLQ